MIILSAAHGPVYCIAHIARPSLGRQGTPRVCKGQLDMPVISYDLLWPGVPERELTSSGAGAVHQDGSSRATR